MGKTIVLIGPVHPFRGGIAQHTGRLAHALEQAGHRVEIITFRALYPHWLYPGKSQFSPEDSSPPVPIPTRALLTPYLPWTWELARQEVLALRPALVLFQWWTPFWAAAAAYLARQFRRAGLPVVFLVHNALPHEPGPLDRWLSKLALRVASGYIIHAESERKRLEELLPGKRLIESCPHPLFDWQPSTLSKPEARCAWNLPAKAVVLLFFGFVRPYKGLDVLLDALGQLRQRRASLPYLVVAGEFWKDARLYSQQIERLGLTGHVRLENGYIPDRRAADLFQAADLFVAPYRSATQSGAVKLAMSFGLPLLVTEPAVDELVQSWPAVKIVPAGDAAVLADALQDWLDSLPTRLPRPDSAPGWAALVSCIEKFLPE